MPGALERTAGWWPDLQAWGCGKQGQTGVHADECQVLPKLPAVRLRLMSCADYHMHAGTFWPAPIRPCQCSFERRACGEPDDNL